MHAIRLVAPIALIALCMTLGVVQHRLETRMTEPAWLANMTDRQKTIIGTAIILTLIVIGSIGEIVAEYHGTSIVH